LGKGPNEYRLRYIVAPEPADKGAAYVVREANTTLKVSLLIHVHLAIRVRVHRPDRKDAEGAKGAKKDAMHEELRDAKIAWLKRLGYRLTIFKWRDCYVGRMLMRLAECA